MYNCICIRCDANFLGKYPKTKVCKQCSKRGQPRGEKHWNYKTGAYTYETFRKELRDAKQFCERCKKDLSCAGHYEWVIHHIDHDHYNNELNNLELLCKRCHQIEHDCVGNLEGATTIPRGSTAK